MRTVLAFVSLLILGVGTAFADDLRGEDDPRFQSALALWLDDDEKTALPEFAALAAGGNRAAQILLAQIDVTLSLQGPWVAQLPRKRRITLLRAPGGLSGRSWMQAAAEDTPLARLWLAQQSPAATPETALAFAGLGEHRAARNVLWNLSRRDYRGFAALADDPSYPPDMRYLIWREWAADPVARARADAEIAALHPGDPQLSHFDSRPLDPAAFDDWLAAAPLAALLRVPCEAMCPSSVGSCARAGFQLLSSYSGSVAVFVSGHNGLLLLGSPWETIVSAERWNASPRGRATLLREPYARSSEAKGIMARIAAEDACFAAALTEEVARFSK